MTEPDGEPCLLCEELRNRSVERHRDGLLRRLRYERSAAGRSAAGELGLARAVLDERGHADAPVVGGEERREQLGLQVRPVRRSVSRPPSMASFAAA